MGDLGGYFVQQNKPGIDKYHSSLSHVEFGPVTPRSRENCGCQRLGDEQRKGGVG
jgi:hypothetical protein